jgi:halimadienyl-diphosphate synthase
MISETTSATPEIGWGITGQVEALFAKSAADPHGAVSPSIYETARIITLAPWLYGQDERVEFLLNQQRPDGVWGGPGEYAMVPTLSATEALLRDLTNSKATRPPRSQVARAAERGVGALRRMLRLQHRPQFSDTIASELIVPALIQDINWLRGSTVLEIPEGAAVGLLQRLRSDPAPVSPKLKHTLEIFGASPALTAVDPVAGNIGCSPASTAAWLAAGRHTDRAGPAVCYLEDVVKRYSGIVPSVAPITTFEYAWIVTTLCSANINAAVPPRVRDTLRHALTGQGAAVGEGLLCDADTTAETLFALLCIGDVRKPDVLLGFDTGEHFCCWPGERNPSVSANAHVLEAIANYVARTGMRDSSFGPIIRRVSAWLEARQHSDGNWVDKWHASAYYATAVCVRAMTVIGGRTAVDRARRWVLETQRPDGSWGRWCGTSEETAYAVQILLRGGVATPAMIDAAVRGADYLRRPNDSAQPPLWHDKDLYAPGRVIAAEVLAALHLVQCAVGEPIVSGR